MKSLGNITPLHGGNFTKIVDQLFADFLIDFHKEDEESAGFRKSIRYGTDIYIREISKWRSLNILAAGGYEQIQTLYVYLESRLFEYFTQYKNEHVARWKRIVLKILLG